jgi:hypothetical protein
VGFFDWLKGPPDTEPAPIQRVPEEVPAESPAPVDPVLAAGREQAAEIAAYRPGRPKAGEHERTKRIGLAVSEAEHARLKAAAEAAGRKQLSRWCREVLFAHLENEDAAESGAVSADVQAQLVRIGNNLNQLTRAANQGGTVDAEALDEVRSQFQALRMVL